jgi:hypothetical protein
MTTDPDFSGPSGPNWRLLLMLALSAMLMGLATFGAFTLTKLIL